MARVDEDRVFDISKPHKVTANATSRPIIAGHNPTISDPMVTDNTSSPPVQNSNEPKSTSVPISFDDKDEAEPSEVKIAGSDEEIHGNPQSYMSSTPSTEQPTETAPQPISDLPLSSNPFLSQNHEQLTVKPPDEVSAPEPSPESSQQPVVAAPEPEASQQPQQAEPFAVVPAPNDVGLKNETDSPETSNPSTMGPSMTDVGSPDNIVQPENIVPMQDLPLPTHNGGGGHHQRKSKKWLWIVIAIVVLLGAYAYVDAATDIKLPVYFLRKTTPAPQPQVVVTKTTNTQPQTPTNNQNLNNQSVDTTDWISYTNSIGKFLFMYPKTWALPSNVSECPNSIILLGADKESVGKCNSEDTGQMAIIYQAGDQRSTMDLTSDSNKDIVKTPVTADGVIGQKETGTVTDAVKEGKPVGTKVVAYVFYTNSTTYGFEYAQLDNQPDVLDEFNALVTQTLKFNK